MSGSMTTGAESGDSRSRRRIILPWVVLAIGIPASFLLFALFRDAVEDTARLRFERQASDARRVIDVRMHSYAGVLYGLRALFTGSHTISRLEFHRFVKSLDLKHRYPSLESVNYMVYVPAGEKARFEESVRRDTSLVPHGYPNFSIKPPGERRGYYVIVYLEPMAGFEFAFGLDLGTNPNAVDPEALAAAVQLTRDSGQLIASGIPLRITTGSREYIALAMRLAVYQAGMPTDTVAQRQAAFIGSVGAGFNVQDLMKGVLDEETVRYLRFWLYDAGSAIEPVEADSQVTKRLLFDSNQLIQPSSARLVTENPDAVFSRVLPIEIGGRHWELRFSARKDAIMEPTDALLPWLVLGGGLLSSALLFGMFYSLASSRSRAVEIANEITRDLRVSTEQLQAMSRRLVDIQESERRQFSRELHDRVGQNLTALSISLDILKTQLPGNGNESLRTRLDDAATLLESTAGTIENVMSEMRPPMLDDYGLLPALQWYASEFASRTSIDVSVEGDERMERLPQSSEIALFRIVQEALNNVAKHAHAGRVHIALKRADTRLVLSVVDDGVGLGAASAAGARHRHGLGMVTMRERTQAVGGEFEIGSTPGRGTRVVVRVPC
jgi:signal transduction histidine kinase